MWIANQTRPDIAHAVRAIARFSHEPELTHYKAAKKILEYLNAMSDFRLVFEKVSDMKCIPLDFDLNTSANADYAHMAEDRRSIRGGAICCGGTLVGGAISALVSRTQKCVTLSTTEAEYVGTADGVKETLYVRGILEFPTPSLGSASIGVFDDNKGAINLAENPLSLSNSKYMAIRCHGSREFVASDHIPVKYLQ
ncbi:unnamed protein product [Sphacelaria rigidula]